VTEVVRQLRLRDIGGIIVIDFIDMANPKNREAVEEALKRELERDRTKTYVVEISPLGLVEMTRQNVTDGPREILTERCPACHGDGVVVSDETYAVEAERRLRRIAADSRAEGLLVELSARIAGLLIGAAGGRLAEIERETGKRFAFETRDDVPPDHFQVLAEGPAAEIEHQGLPVAPGEELEVILEETHLHHPEDAIARLDGYVVAVAGAAARLGETVRVRIERATRTAAFATLAGVELAAAPVEAELLVEEELEPTVAPEGEPKKRTRRGTRGGRGRKKVVAAEEAAQVEEAEAVAVEEAAPAEEPKKRTRRGTRGGRGRTKATGAARAPRTPATPDPAVAASGDAG
jgi:ribonuclease G